MKLINNTKDLLTSLKLDAKSSLPISNFQIDSRKVQKNSVFFGLNGSNEDGSVYADDAITKGASLVIVKKSKMASSISNSSKIIQVQSPEDILIQAAAIAMKRYKGNIIGVTGSNGKTTTKNILNTCIKNSYATYQNYNNEIGLPLCALELNSQKSTAIFEMGAAKNGDIDLLSKIIKPNIGIITHIGHSHLDGLSSIRGVLKVKSELIKNIKQNGSAIVPDGQYLNYWQKMRKDITFYSFGEKSSASYFPTKIKMSKNGLSFFIESRHLKKRIPVKTRLIGMHNVLNILASFAAIHTSKLSIEEFLNGMNGLQNAPQRLDLKTWVKQSQVIDDTYNANPDSMKAAIDVLCQFKGRKIAILGDMAELGRFRKKLHIGVGDYAKIHGVDCLLGYGDLIRHAVFAYGDNAFFFNKKTELMDFLKKNLVGKEKILIKGSRSMRMEEILELWK
ncbi:MAG: UDP-N-acetylmuramoyl-tripeptide--D-alanyl-D-alanine ligase [SAR86 cluster bacterium]|uniref:UDP-N-acetylmuramoyl-tripeptide--D-alanyl-D-alanine ligase n=1 Tax=SAR86 cluster bacterium TaxID=2030880 RepID=A0A368BMI5_9GAMM|nr:MAG: UDP-N-acetylmuramoyl-tripeptide--D-alanyl-D-alanine ligase [SAR86 cluster bacterium]